MLVRAGEVKGWRNKLGRMVCSGWGSIRELHEERLKARLKTAECAPQEIT